MRIIHNKPKRVKLAKRNRGPNRNQTKYEPLILGAIDNITKWDGKERKCCMMYGANDMSLRWDMKQKIISAHLIRYVDDLYSQTSSLTQLIKYINFCLNP